jgi:hypothetical protein
MKIKDFIKTVKVGKIGELKNFWQECSEIEQNEIMIHQGPKAFLWAAKHDDTATLKTLWELADGFPMVQFRMLASLPKNLVVSNPPLQAPSITRILWKMVKKDAIRIFLSVTYAGHLDIASYLFAAAKAVNKEEDIFIGEYEELRYAPFIIAAEKGRKAMVQYLLDSAPRDEIIQAMLTAAGEDGRPFDAIRMATLRKDFAMVRLLLAYSNEKTTEEALAAIKSDTQISPKIKRGIGKAAIPTSKLSMEIAVLKGNIVACQDREKRDILRARGVGEQFNLALIISRDLITKAPKNIKDLRCCKSYVEECLKDHLKYYDLANQNRAIEQLAICLQKGHLDNTQSVTNTILAKDIPTVLLNIINEYTSSQPDLAEEVPASNFKRAKCESTLERKGNTSLAALVQTVVIKVPENSVRFISKSSLSSSSSMGSETDSPAIANSKQLPSNKCKDEEHDLNKRGRS